MALTQRIGGVERAVVEWVNQLPKWKAALLTVFGLAVCATIDGKLDTAFQYDWQLTIGYMLPVSFAAWSLGLGAGILAASVSIALDLMSPGASDLAARHSYSILRGVEIAQFGILAFGAFIMSRMRAHLDQEKALSRTDHLTGCWNARVFWERLDIETSRMGRTGEPLSVVFFDVDDFKNVNDTHGHTVGDQLLKTIGAVLQDELRSTDLPARMGGDEFAIILPETPSDMAVKVSDRIRKRINAEASKFDVHATISVGVTTYTGEPNSLHELVANADKLMYSVKSNGKDALAFQVN